jgi:hypothetical protein
MVVYSQFKKLPEKFGDFNYVSPDIFDHYKANKFVMYG